MSDFRIIGYGQDLRTSTHVVYAQTKISDYLNFVGDDFDEFEIQRKRENHKGYARLKKDIKDGALIPPITLALKPSLVKKCLPLVKSQKTRELEAILTKSASVYILDGLQRTHIMSDLRSEGVVFKDSQNLLLECWFEEDMSNLIYRLIVLNSGQKPMSMRHQIELLFMTMQEKLKTDIPSLELYSERELATRDHANKFPFERIVTGYHSFLNESAEVDKGKIIVDRLDSGKIVTDVDMLILERYRDYVNYLTQYLKIDSAAYSVYEKFRGFASAKHWLAEENVINSFFAAIGLLYGVPEFRSRVDKGLERLLNNVKKSNPGDDPFDLEKFDGIREKFNPKQYNVGFATRKTITGCFLEFFRNEGLMPFGKCWTLSDATQNDIRRN